MAAADGARTMAQQPQRRRREGLQPGVKDEPMMADDSVAPCRGLLSFWLLYPEFCCAPLRAMIWAHLPVLDSRQVMRVPRVLRS